MGTDASDLRTHLQATLAGAYTLERELGGGGMARVFVAEETALGRRVVVKVLASDLARAALGERWENSGANGALRPPWLGRGGRRRPPNAVTGWQLEWPNPAKAGHAAPSASSHRRLCKTAIRRFDSGRRLCPITT